MKLATIYGRVQYGWDTSDRAQPVKVFMFHCPRTNLYVVDREHGFDGYLCTQCGHCKFNRPKNPTYDKPSRFIPRSKLEVATRA